jgi:nitrite reductase/ring-hydroxylating ferredoxin subunit
MHRVDPSNNAPTPTSAPATSPPRASRSRPVPFPDIPSGWFYLCRSRDLRPGPVRVTLDGATRVGFRDDAGRPVTLDARCSHMGADLSRGRVIAGRIRCPLHAWEYAGDGRCVRIPAAEAIPPFACQPTFPTAEVGGHVVFHNAPAAPYSFPFYDRLSPADLLPAEPFDFTVGTPWYMIGANAFDLQHFRIAHDRTLVNAPVIDSPSPWARRITADYDVTGTSLRDRLTRRFSGPRVRMSVTVWSGTLILVTAEFRRTTSYGMVFVRPLPGGRSHLRTIVWVPRRRTALRRALLDPLDARVRRGFIRAFMTDDAVRSDGVGYNPETLIDADRELRNYFSWLAGLNSPSLPHVPRGEGRGEGPL